MGTSVQLAKPTSCPMSIHKDRCESRACKTLLADRQVDREIADVFDHNLAGVILCEHMFKSSITRRKL